MFMAFDKKQLTTTYMIKNGIPKLPKPNTISSVISR